MTVEDNIAAASSSTSSSDQRLSRAPRSDRRVQRASPILKTGIALTPVKFGISFTLTHLNQAGALVHVYQDGSVHLNHGGTEMGQGLFSRWRRSSPRNSASALDTVKITATSTDKVPNTSPTAASAGTDLNGKAARIAARDDQGRGWSISPPRTGTSTRDRDRVPR